MYLEVEPPESTGSIERRFLGLLKAHVRAAWSHLHVCFKNGQKFYGLDHFHIWMNYVTLEYNKCKSAESTLIHLF